MCKYLKGRKRQKKAEKGKKNTSKSGMRAPLHNPYRNITVRLGLGLTPSRWDAELAKRVPLHHNVGVEIDFVEVSGEVYAVTLGTMALKWG